MRFDEPDSVMDENDDAPIGAAAQEDGEKTMSLMGGVAGVESLTEADLLDVDGTGSTGRQSPIFNQGTLLILVVFVVAIGSLYTMRMSQGDLKNGAAPSKWEAIIEDTLAKITHPQDLAADDPLHPQNLESLRSTSSVLEMFKDDPTQRQVPIEYVKKDPFDLPQSKPAAPVVVAVAAPPPDDELAKRRKALQQELGQLRLQTVISGPRPAAIINNEVVQPGQRVGSFIVKKIDALSVQLTSDDQTYVLKMDDGTTSGSGRNSGRSSGPGKRR